MKEYAHILRALADGKQGQLRIAGAWGSCQASEILLAIYNGEPPDVFRIKPETIDINGHEVPAPLRVAPKIGDLVYVPNVFTVQLCQWMTWDGAPSEFLDRGIFHSSKEAAIAHARALLSFTEQKP